MHPTYTIPDENFFSALRNFPPPVLIISTHVGRGMFTLGDAFQERLPKDWVCHHHAIEEFLPRSAIDEDVRRYRFIISRMPFLLHVIYRVPFFYYRKAWREQRGAGTDLSRLQTRIEETGALTVVCVSHRAAFWTALLKRRACLPVFLWGLLGEYGRSLGWKYVDWEVIDGYLSPMSKDSLRLPIPDRVQFAGMELPARTDYYEVARHPGNPDDVLLIGGYWGTGPLKRVLAELAREMPELRISVICGDNKSMQRQLRQTYTGNGNILIEGVVPSIIPWLQPCASVITKPGISTLLEAHAAGRQIFMLPGAPVAEENNARYAETRWGSQRYGLAAFRAWHARAKAAAREPAEAV